MSLPVFLSRRDFGFTGGTMGMIPDSVIEEILSKADIESVVGRYVSFTKRSGQNLFGLCPFHSEKTPSFSVSPNKGIYHCFGCGKGGNSISFIREIERLSYPEAVRFLGKQYGVEVPEYNTGYNDDSLRQKKERVRALLNEAGIFYHNCLNDKAGKPGRDYAAKRELKPDTVKMFGIGYAPEGWDILASHLRSKGYTDDEMKDSGLFTVSRKTGKLIDLFRGRLVFPIFDAFGNIVAFGGRALGDELPKYVNSPDSLVYKKQEHLYALNIAKKSRSGRLIIVEGYMDAIAMHQAGVDNAVASLGTAFTEAQIRLASKYAEEIIFFFDADKAGQSAAIRAIKMMLRYLRKMTGLKIRIKIACVPDNKDPDEYIRNNGREKFAEVVRRAKDVDDYLADRAYNDNYSDDYGLDLHKYQEDIITYGAWIHDDIRREKMAASAAVYLGVNYVTVLNRMNDAEIAMEKEQAAADERSRRRDMEADISDRMNYDNTDVSEPYNGTDNEAYAEDRQDTDGSAGETDVKPSVTDGHKAGVRERNADVAYAGELKVFIYAVRLREALMDPKTVKKEDVLTPGDFIGRNMQEIAGYFLNNFEEGYGIREALLINELGKYVLNGRPAEEVYLSMCDSIEEKRDLTIARDLYLAELYSLRLTRLDRIQQALVKRLGTSSDKERTELNDKLRKVISMKDRIRQKAEEL